jgi:hypothetical protein
MTFDLPIGRFEWVNVNSMSVHELIENEDTILEVDIEYPECRLVHSSVKPIAVGFTILENSKWWMFHVYYDIIIPNNQWFA